MRFLNEYNDEPYAPYVHSVHYAFHMHKEHIAYNMHNAVLEIPRGNRWLATKVGPAPHRT